MKIITWLKIRCLERTIIVVAFSINNSIIIWCLLTSQSTVLAKTSDCFNNAKLSIDNSKALLVSWRPMPVTSLILWAYKLKMIFSYREHRYIEKHSKAHKQLKYSSLFSVLKKAVANVCTTVQVVAL